MGTSARPAAAVLLCVYRNDNSVHFAAALQSIAGQDIASHDIRVYLGVDGVVPPRIEAVISAFPGLIHKVQRNRRNIGLALTLNSLIDQLEDEEFVFRADADDISEPSRFRLQIDYLDAHPDLSLIGAQAIDIDLAGTPQGDRNFPLRHETIVQAMAYVNPVLHPSYAMRRAILADPMVRYRPYYLSEDLDFVMRLALAGHRLGNVPERLVRFRTAGAFFARRTSLKRGLVELQLYSGYIRKTRGLLSPAHGLAFARFVMRLIPRSWADRLYRSSLRHRLLRLRERQSAAK
ncbi:glycosyltransferase [Stappia sp. F7233]|uniref:Glycosyltransferase n=2 Tax=Stappia albiluteola TaxID=2758565 RepID=A0A839ABX2_9HYPH|nr:glycosyltransferase [Stappia albiluteola]